MAKKGQIGIDTDVAAFLKAAQNTSAEKLEKVYSETVGNKFKNFSRKASRFMRDEVAGLRKDVLKEAGLTEAQATELIRKVNAQVYAQYGTSDSHYRWVQA